MISDLVRPARTVRELLNAGAEAYGDAPILMSESKDGFLEISYRQYTEEIKKLAIIFARKHGSGQIVVLPGSLSKAWLMAFFSIIYSGNIAVPADLSKGEGEIVRNLNKLSPDIIFTEKAYAKAAEQLKEAFPDRVKETIEEWYEQASKEALTLNSVFDDETGVDISGVLKPQSPEDTAVLIFTSGTTGDSKIVELTNRNLCADGLLAALYMDSSHPVGARVLSSLPVFHLYGISAPFFGGYVRGFCFCLGGGAWTFRNDLQKYKPEIILVVPQIIYNFGRKLLPAEGVEENEDASMQRAAAAKQFFGGSLKCVITGGAPIDPLYEYFFSSIGIFMMNGYGITECSPIVSCDVPSYHRKGAIGKTGIAPDLCIVKIDDGEICVKGEIVSPGYWKDPALNQEAYTDGWFRTGDLGRLDEEDYLYITGRKKNVLILPDGNNISLDELESEIEKCPEVDSVMVLGSVIKETAMIEAIIYPVQESGRSPEENLSGIDAWINEMNRKNVRYKRIAEWKITDKPFERTALGKIQKYKYSAK